MRDGPTPASERVTGRTIGELLNLKAQEIEDAVDGLLDTLRRRQEGVS